MSEVSKVVTREESEWKEQSLEHSGLLTVTSEARSIRESALVGVTTRVPIICEIIKQKIQTN